MSQTLLRGLALLEAVDAYGPMTLAELTRRVGWDKASVSRSVASCVAEGWLAREGSQVTIGTRVALLGRGSQASHAVYDAETLVHTVSGVTGLPTQAYVLAGDRVIVIAAAAPPGTPATLLRSVRLPLWASAAAKVIAAQLPDDLLRSKVPEELPLDELAGIATSQDIGSFQQTMPEWVHGSSLTEGTTLVATRAELERQLRGIRDTGAFVERRELGPDGSCVAVPWATTPGMVASLACIATIGVVEHDGPRIERALRAAAAPGATRESIVSAAAERPRDPSA